MRDRMGGVEVVLSELVWRWSENNRQRHVFVRLPCQDREAVPR